MKVVQSLLEHGKHRAGSRSHTQGLATVEAFEPRLLLSGDIAIACPAEVDPNFIPGDTATPWGTALTPSQIRSAYGFDQVSFGSIAGDGAGQTIAVIGFYDDPGALNDLNYFSSQFDLPRFNVPGGPTFTKVGKTGGAVPGRDPAGPGAATTDRTRNSNSSRFMTPTSLTSTQ